MYMATKSCPDCGYPLNGSERTCPECGYPIVSTAMYASDRTNIQPVGASVQNVPASNTSAKTDWAHYFYECGVIGWESFKKYAVFTGRASRREFWSLHLLFLMSFGLTFSLTRFIFLLPIIGVAIRRMHDIGKCGWWCICPIACIFLFLKRSDEGPNEYGFPEPAKNLL